MPVEGVKQIKIYLDSSIPDSKPVVFTSDMLVYEGKQKLEKYPFILTNARYSDALRYRLRMMKYKDVVSFFFTRKIFEKYLSGDIKKTSRKLRAKKNNKTKKGGQTQAIEKLAPVEEPPKPETKTNLFPKCITGTSDDEDIAKTQELREIMRENYALMLELIFPTSFPVPNNLNTSMYYLTNEYRDKLVRHLSFKNTMPGAESKLSFITIDGKKYTITGVYWINDILNYPVYRAIINNYASFDKWMEDSGKKMKDKFEEERKQFVSSYLAAFVLEYANQQIKSGKSDDLVFWRPIKNPEQRTGVIVSSTENYESIETYTANSNKLNEIYKININNGEASLQDIDKLSKPETSLINDIFLDLDLTLKAFEKIQRPNLGDKTVNIYKKIAKNFKVIQDKQIIYDYVYNISFDYLKDEPEEVANNIKKDFPKFDAVAKSIIELKTRNIENQLWKSIAKSIQEGNKVRSDQISYVTKFKVILKKIMECYDILNTGDTENDGDCLNSDLHESIGEKVKGQNTTPEKVIKLSSECMKYFFSVGFDTIKDDDPNKSEGMEIIESYLMLNLIEGEINPETKSKIKCDFENKDLGRRWNDLVDFEGNQWDIENRKFFYRISDAEKTQPTAPPAATAPVVEAAPIAPPEIKKNGGRIGETKKTRKKRKYGSNVYRKK